MYYILYTIYCVICNIYYILYTIGACVADGHERDEEMAVDPAVQLIDQRGIAKVPTFSGRREHFEEWAFPFESYCGLLGWERFIDSAKVSAEEIEILNFERRGRAGRPLALPLAG